MVQLLTIADIPSFDAEPKAVIKTILETYKEHDVHNVEIDAERLPEILSSLVLAWDPQELMTLVEAVDEDASGKLDLSKISQIIIYFLKKENRDKVLTKVSLKISTQMCISEDVAMMIVYFYPQIIKAVDDGHCILQ